MRPFTEKGNWGVGLGQGLGFPAEHNSLPPGPQRQEDSACDEGKRTPPTVSKHKELSIVQTPRTAHSPSSGK